MSTWVFDRRIAHERVAWECREQPGNEPALATMDILESAVEVDAEPESSSKQVHNLSETIHMKSIIRLWICVAAVISLAAVGSMLEASCSTPGLCDEGNCCVTDGDGMRCCVCDCSQYGVCRFCSCCLSGCTVYMWCASPESPSLCDKLCN